MVNYLYLWLILLITSISYKTFSLLFLQWITIITLILQDYSKERFSICRIEGKIITTIQGRNMVVIAHKTSHIVDRRSASLIWAARSLIKINIFWKRSYPFPKQSLVLQLWKKASICKTLWEKKTILQVSVFSLFHGVVYPKRRILDSSKLKELADDNLKFDENGIKFSERVENTAGKGEIARCEQFLLFPQCFQKTCTADT